MSAVLVFTMTACTKKNGKEDSQTQTSSSEVLNGSGTQADNGAGTQNGSETDAENGGGTEAGNNAGTQNGTGPQNGQNAFFQSGMVTDTGGVNDQSFNQSAWEGLTEFKNNTGCEVSYLESKQETDYASNLDKMVDSGNTLIWGIGFAMADAISTAAEMNPDISYAIIDNGWDQVNQNMTGVMFRAQEPSFMVGYAAGLTTKTGRIGFVGGMSSDIIDQFEYGYKAGAAYAAKELGHEIRVDVMYAESFTDAAKGKSIAMKMFSDGCDIVYHASGGVGPGVIEAAKEAGKFAIGVDRDQLSLAPDNVLTSALKNVKQAVLRITEMAYRGEDLGGMEFNFGLTEDAVGIPEENPNMDPEVYEKTLAVGESIKAGDIVPPYNRETYEEFIK